MTSSALTYMWSCPRGLYRACAILYSISTCLLAMSLFKDSSDMCTPSMYINWLQCSLPNKDALQYQLSCSSVVRPLLCRNFAFPA